MVRVHPCPLYMTSLTTTFTVSAPLANQRLDIFLTKKLGVSRSQVRKMIDNKQITINDKQPKKAGNLIKDGDKIILSKIIKKPKLPKTIKQPKPAANSAKYSKLNIVAETDDYLVINKPSGLLTHPTMARESMSVASVLAKKYPEIKKVGDDPETRPGIVHRLDKEASGLLVVARTQKMFGCLKEQFKKREIEKEYLVLVHGKIHKDWDEINFPIKRTKNSDRMAAIPYLKDGLTSDDGREAKTEFLVEKRFVNFTLLRVKIYTGRMHQIRTHFLAYNHPIVGDPLYFQKKQKRKWDEKCGRLFLHCCQLGFVNLKNEKKKFTIELPLELESFLKNLH